MNFKYRTFNVALLLALSISACTKPQIIQYKNSKPAPTNAELSFESDLDTHTYFSVNEHPEEVCNDFKSVGYILHADSIFLYDKPNEVIKIKMPTDKPIAVRSFHQFSDPGMRSSCYPPAGIFQPEPHQNYVVKMNFKSTGSSSGICTLTVSKVDSDGSRTNVPIKKQPRCAKK